MELSPKDEFIKRAHMIFHKIGYAASPHDSITYSIYKAAKVESSFIDWMVDMKKEFIKERYPDNETYHMTSAEMIVERNVWLLAVSLE